MLSLNVPVPAAVARRAADLAREWPSARARARDEHTLVAKRLGDDDPAVLRERLRETLAGQAPFAARVADAGLFEAVPSGPAPVLYLAVESPGLRAVHERCCAAVDPVEDLEGDAYVPHVTVARGGDVERARALAEQGVDPVEWTVDRLTVYDAERGVGCGELALPP